MEPDFFSTDLYGNLIPAGDLRILKAQDLAHRLQARNIEFATLIECRQNLQTETIIFDVDVEVPQICRHPIRSSERITATFYETDDIYPTVHALRKNFPVVPHLNLHIQELPRNLCLYDERYEEVKHRWTSPRFVHRIRDWLALTAKGDLHQEDQPLEQILIGDVGHLVLPEHLLEVVDNAQPLFVGSICPVDNEKLFLIAQRESQDNREALDIVASVHRCPPQTHGVIHRRPRTLSDLAALVEDTGLDLLAELRRRLKDWYHDNKAFLDSRLLLVVQFPKKRNDDAEVEAIETRAFFLGYAANNGDSIVDLRIRDIGISIDLWQPNPDNNDVGLVIGSNTAKCGEDICLDMLNVSSALSRSEAARLNGYSTVDDIRIVGIGVGALGSQVVMNLARSGFGTWTIIDHDRLMPHNIARHFLTGHFIGWKKAEAMALSANTIASNEDLFTALPVDLLAPGKREEKVITAFRDAEAIIDMSTSIAIARKLSYNVDSDARRLSLFLVPSGYDLVLLAEDKDRTLPLDALEMQYYRAVANRKVLSTHFQTTGQRTRYGQSCRDITSTLPQNLVALHSAIGAQAIKKAVNDHGATVCIWKADDNGNVQRIDIELTEIIYQRRQNWTVVTDIGLLEKLGSFRKAKLPNETGGVLLGSFNLDYKILYIVDALPSPSDSEEWPALYIRGRKGLHRKVERITETTRGMLEYIGEWHSHPTGTSTAASCDDLKVFAWIAELMQSDGLPAVMMIVGDPGRTSCYVGEIMREENLLPEEQQS